MFEENHRFKKAVGHGTGTCPASSNGYPPLGKKSGGYAPPLSRNSRFAVREKNPVLRIVSRWDGEHCSPPVHFYYPCETNTFNNDIIVNNLSIDAPSTVSSVQNYTYLKNTTFECVFTTRCSNFERQLDCPKDDRENLPVSLLTVVIASQESGYNNNSGESDSTKDPHLTGNPPGNLPNFHSPGVSFSQNKEACLSSYSTQFLPMDCSSSNSYTDD